MSTEDESDEPKGSPFLITVEMDQQNFCSLRWTPIHYQLS
jgi:hypothetical protein